MKSSVELSIELLDAKIERVSVAVAALNAKAAKILQESDKLQVSLDKLQKEKQKLLNSEAYKKTEAYRNQQNDASNAVDMLNNAANAANV